MNSLLPVLMILGSLHGAPVKIDWVTQEEDLTDVPAASSEETLVSSLGLPRASSLIWLSVKSTVLPSKSEAGETGFPLQLPGESLTTAEGFANEPRRPSATSPGLDGEGSSLALSKSTDVVIGLKVPTTLLDTVYSQWTNPRADALDFTSTGHILPPSSTVSGRSDQEVTTSLFQFAMQPAFNSEGTTTLDRKDNLQNTPPPNSTSRSDAMETLAESAVDGIVTRGLTPFESVESSPQSLPSTAVPSSLGSETAPAVRLRTGAVSWDSTFEELSNSTSIESAGPSSSSEIWQDAPEDEPTTSVSVSCTPDVSDTSSAASFASITPAPDVGEATSTAASPSFHGAGDVSMSSVESLPTNQPPGVTNAYSTDSSLSSTLLALSEAGYTTSVSIAQDPDVPYLFTSRTPVDPVASTTAPPASGQWLPDVSEYSTALSVSITEARGLSRLSPASRPPETSTYSVTASVSADWFSDASEYPAASHVSIAHVPDATTTHSTADPTLSVTDSYSTSWSPSDAFSSVSAQQLSDVVVYATTNRAVDHYSTFALPIASGSTAVSDPCSATPCVSTLASDLPTSDALVSSWPSDAPEHTVASSVSLVQDFGISGTYSTSASVYSEQSSDVSDRSHNPDVSTYSMSSSPSVLTDVSDYSTAPSSIIHLTPDNSASSTAFVTTDILDVPFATSQSPDVSDTYSTAVSSDSTQWQSDVSDYSRALSVTSWSPDVWLAGNSKVGTSMVSPHTQQTTWIKATSTEMPGSERHVSVSLTHTSPLSSETLSSTPIWKPFPSEKLFTTSNTTSHDYPAARSPTSIRLSPRTSQPFTKATAIGTNPGTSAFAFELSETASLYSQTAQSSPGIQAPLLLQFAILNQSYSHSLRDRSSEDYKELEAVVDRTLRAIFHARYRDNFLGIEILGFRNGSVRVECEVVFQVKANVPSSSDIVRTVLTHVYRQDHSPSELVMDASSVACNGYSLANLQPEALLIEFTALSVGFGPWMDEPMFLSDLLQRLSSWVVATLEEKYFVREFNIGRVISIQGDVNIQGTALLSTPVHVGNAEVLMLLNDLVNRSVDLRSLRVNGSAMNLGVLPISFAIENHEYNTTLRDSRSAYFCSLGGVVTRALQAILKPRYSNFVQAVVSHFGRHSSVISTCDLMFLHAAPASREVLDIFFNLVNGNGFLTGTDIKVDAYSFTVGDARLERPYQPIHFPGFGIALILMCSLAVISLPVVAFLCWKYSFWATCQEGVLHQQWDLDQNMSLHLPLPEMKPERYRLNETYANYSFEF